MAKAKDKDAVAELAVLDKIKPALEAGLSARTVGFLHQKKKNW